MEGVTPARSLMHDPKMQHDSTQQQMMQQQPTRSTCAIGKQTLAGAVVARCTGKLRRIHLPMAPSLGLLSLFAMVLFVGCASTGARSTRMTVGDLNAMADAMAQSLARSDALRERTADSPLWVISIDKVLNLSSDVMTEAEQWFVIAKLRGSLPLQAMSKERNIRFVIPAEQTRKMRRDPNLDTRGDTFGSERKPTHQMTATFHSATRADATHRTELYYCEFVIIEFATAVPVWTDKFEYKRGAVGHVWD